jgi:hypothetical protein
MSDTSLKHFSANWRFASWALPGVDMTNGIVSVMLPIVANLRYGTLLRYDAGWNCRKRRHAYAFQEFRCDIGLGLTPGDSD